MFTICLEVYHGNWTAINWGDNYSQECFIAGFWVSWGSTVFTWRVHSDIFDPPSTWSCPLIPLNLPNKQVEFDIPEVECTKNVLGNQWVIVSSWPWGCWSHLRSLFQRSDWDYDGLISQSEAFQLAQRSGEGLLNKADAPKSTIRQLFMKD